MLRKELVLAPDACMNKKDIAEIRKQFTEARCAISRICGCYVSAEKEKVTTFKEAFLSLEQEEMFKYFEIFKKSLSGSLGKSLLNMDFPLEAEEEGGTQHFLLSLRDSHLQDDDLLDTFYDKIIETYAVPDNYLILLISQVYDVPGRSTVGDEMFDASDEVYDHILCAICPVALSKPALSYDGEEHTFRSRSRDWIVDKPTISFLFPAFNDRQTDLHSLLFYTKKSEEMHTELIDSLLGTTIPLTAGAQKDVFQDLIEETLGDECEYDIVRSLHSQLHEISEQQKESPDPITLSQVEVRHLLEESGAEYEQMEHFDELYEETVGAGNKLMAANIINARSYEVSTPDISIKVSPDRSDLVETRIIDGRPCLVIPITDEVHVNGIRVTAGKTDND